MQCGINLSYRPNRHRHSLMVTCYQPRVPTYLAPGGAPKLLRIQSTTRRSQRHVTTRETQRGKRKQVNPRHDVTTKRDEEEKAQHNPRNDVTTRMGDETRTGTITQTLRRTTRHDVREKKKRTQRPYATRTCVLTRPCSLYPPGPKAWIRLRVRARAFAKIINLHAREREREKQ